MNSIPPYAIDLPDDHSIKVYLDEHTLIESLLERLEQADIIQDYECFFSLFSQLAGIEQRFVRKENQLFPFLEKHGWTGPSKGMWALHDKIRNTLRDIRTSLESKEREVIDSLVGLLIKDLRGLLHIEKTRLFPNALSLISDDEFIDMKKGDAEVGRWLDTQKQHSTKEEYLHPGDDTKKRSLPFSLDDRICLDEGYLTTEQLNLLLQFMPVDITYVDENDRVVFYNRGKNRVFPRSAGIIGREVKFCHPPKSVDKVLTILSEFKKGNQQQAQFWINYQDRKIHIRFLAIRDQHGQYKGVVELTQDITEILKIEGENRLIDWC